MADTTQDSASDALRKVYVNLAQAQLAPDAGGTPAGQFITALMGAIQKFLITSSTATIGGGSQPGAQPIGGGGGGMMDQMGAAPPQQMGPGGGAGNVGLAPSQGNMDEMRRMLTAGAAGP